MQRHSNLNKSLNFGRLNDTHESTPKLHFAEDKNCNKIVSVNLHKSQAFKRSVTTRDPGSPKAQAIKKKRAPPKRLESEKINSMTGNGNAKVNDTTPATPVFEEGRGVLSFVDSNENIESSKGLLAHMESRVTLPIEELEITPFNKDFNQ